MKTELAPIVIREALLEDIPALSELLVHSFNADMDGSMGRWLKPLLRLSIQADLQQRFRNPAEAGCCVVAVCGGEEHGSVSKLVGTVEVMRRSRHFWPLSPQYLYISNLAVSVEYRRQGIARRLLRECEAIAHRWEFPDLYLHVRENNKAARHLYRQMGYRVDRVDFNLGTLVLGQAQTLLLHKQLRTE